MGSTTTRTNRCLLLAFGLALLGCHSRPDEVDRTALLPHEIPADLTHSNSAAHEEIPTSPSTDRATVIFVEFVATPQDIVVQMLQLAGVTADDVVYDLGCGDGRIVVTAAKEYGCRAVGYDLDRLRVAEARAQAEKHGVAHLVTIEQRNVLTVDLREATVVMLYLGTDLNARLLPQLKQLKPGSRIVSHNFGIEGVTPEKLVTMPSSEDDRGHPIYLWTCPLNVTK